MTRIVKLLLLFCVVFAAPVRAALTIEITQGMEGAIPIAVVPLGWRGSAAAAPENIAAVSDTAASFYPF